MRETFNILLEDDQKIYNKWVKSGYSNQFCKDNFLNVRAFK